MISLRRPSEQRIRKFMQSQNCDALTYQEVGQSSGEMPANYFHNEHVVELGRGEACFSAARDNLSSGRCFQLDWVRLYNDGPLRVGRKMAIVARVMGVWTLNGCRVVDVQTESEPHRDLRFSYALGTLPRHIMIGEERFTISLNAETERVWFSIRSFSRAGTVAAAVGGPLIRHYQRRFVNEVAKAMQEDLRS